MYISERQNQRVLSNSKNNVDVNNDDDARIHPYVVETSACPHVDKTYHDKDYNDCDYGNDNDEYYY